MKFKNKSDTKLPFEQHGKHKQVTSNSNSRHEFTSTSQYIARKGNFCEEWEKDTDIKVVCGESNTCDLI